MNFFSTSSERQRREPRYKYSTLVHYRFKEREIVWNYAHTVDISNHGLRLVINCRIANSDMLVLKITLPGEEEPIELQGMAVWRKNLSERSGIQCGIEFDENSCSEYLERFRTYIAAKFKIDLLQNV